MGDGWSTGGGRSRAAQGRAPLQPRRLEPGQPAVAISGYLGSSDRFDRAVVTFAEAYADQTEADYAAFTRAAAPGARDTG